MCDKDFSSAPFKLGIHLANEHRTNSERERSLWSFGKCVRESNANRTFNLHTHLSNDNNKRSRSVFVC